MMNCSIIIHKDGHYFNLKLKIRKLEVKRFKPYPPLGFGSGHTPPLPGAIACLAANPPANSVNNTNATATIFEFIFFMFFESPFNNSKEDFGVAYF